MIREKEYSRGDVARAADFEEDRRSMLSSQAESLMELTSLSGEVALSQTCVAASSAAITRELARARTAASSTIVKCNCGYGVRYPSSLTLATSKAQADSLYDVITLPAISSASVFLGENGDPATGVAVTRSSPVDFAFSGDTDAIYESPAEYAISGKLPYLSIARKAGLDTYTVTVSVSTTAEDFVMNTLRVITYPAVGATTLLSAYPRRGELILSDGNSFPATMIMDYQRSLPLFIPFRTIKTNRLDLTFLSDLAVSLPLSHLILGVTMISGELTSYSEEAWAGFEVTYPDGTTSLTGISIEGAFETDTVTGHSVRVYTSETEFNSVGAGYVYLTETSDVISPGIARPSGGKLWILSNLRRTQGVTPTLRSITLSFS